MVQGAVFSVLDSGCWVQGFRVSGFRIKGAGFRILGAGCRVLVSEFQGFRV